jgi:hypothetical protein
MRFWYRVVPWCLKFATLSCNMVALILRFYTKMFKITVPGRLCRVVLAVAYRHFGGICCLICWGYGTYVLNMKPASSPEDFLLICQTKRHLKPDHTVIISDIGYVERAEDNVWIYEVTEKIESWALYARFDVFGWWLRDLPPFGMWRCVFC